MKKLYENPLITVSDFDTEDIVTTSVTNIAEVENNLGVSLDERLADAQVQQILLTW